MKNQTSFITQTIHNKMKEKKRNGMFDNNFLRSKALGVCRHLLLLYIVDHRHDFVWPWIEK